MGERAPASCPAGVTSSRIAGERRLARCTAPHRLVGPYSPRRAPNRVSKRVNRPALPSSPEAWSYWRARRGLHAA